jgi:hypothetical protein
MTAALRSGFYYKLLNFSGCILITDDCISDLVHSYNKNDGCSKLSSLILSNCSLITDIGILHVFHMCRNLTTLVLSGCVQVSDSAFIQLEKQLPLKILDLSHCHRITDYSLLSISKICHDLEFLNVSFCKLLTDVGISRIIQNCHLLSNLDISECNEISSEILFQISNSLIKLTNLNISGCYLVTDGIQKYMFSVLTFF